MPGRSSVAAVPQRQASQLQERYEAANKQVTSLLEQIDRNVCTATDSAASLLSSVREYAAHTRSMHSSLQIWVNFFSAFEDQERKRLSAGRVPTHTPDLTLESLPSTMDSPCTPSLDDSSRAAMKRRYESPDRTPDFGASPPRSVRLKGPNGAAANPLTVVQAEHHGTCSSASMVGGNSTHGLVDCEGERESFDDDGEQSFSPVSQPNFHLNVSPQLMPTTKNLIASASGDCDWMHAAERSLNDSSTPTISSPTVTVAMSELDSLIKSGPARAFASLSAAESSSSRREDTGHSREGNQWAIGVQDTVGAERGESAVEGLLQGPLSLETLKTLPPVFRVGQGAIQIQRVYGTVKAHADEGLDINQIATLVPYELPRIKFLLDTLVGKNLLRLADCAAADFINDVGPQRYHLPHGPAAVNALKRGAAAVCNENTAVNTRK